MFPRCFLHLLYAVAVANAAAPCNGNPALCDRLYSNVSMVGTHGSAFIGISPMDNQNKSVTKQLDAGIRFLQTQTHKKINTVELCHTNCLLKDDGTLLNYLNIVRIWLENNSGQVVTLLLTNQDAVPVSVFDSLMVAADLKKYVYTPTKHLTLEEWPTLRELIDAKTPLVIFMDYHADIGKVPYILPEFDYFFETPYDTTDSKFAQCTLDRPPNSSPDGKMYMVNHFLDVEILGILIPDIGAIEVTNAATGVGSIGAQADLCFETYQRVPNIVLVDNFDRGDVFTAQNLLNRL